MHGPSRVFRAPVCAVGRRRMRDPLVPVDGTAVLDPGPSPSAGGARRFRQARALDAPVEEGGRQWALSSRGAGATGEIERTVESPGAPGRVRGTVHLRGASVTRAGPEVGGWLPARRCRDPSWRSGALAVARASLGRRPVPDPSPTTQRQSSLRPPARGPPLKDVLPQGNLTVPKTFSDCGHRVSRGLYLPKCPSI